MSDPLISIHKTLVHEGGYSDNSADSGGPTNMGVTQADLPGTPIKDLTVEQATQYYLQNYVKPLYAQISDQFILDKLVDMGILLGVGTATKILQGIFAVHGVVADGIFGPHTLDLVNTAEPVGLLAAYKTTLVSHVVDVVTKNPKNKVFFAGWVRRINS
jgi:lysozyme family protein